jgi:hypothetical protein
MDNDIPNIFDRQLYLQRQSKASPSSRAALHARITEDLTDRLAVITRCFDAALVIADQDFREPLSNSGKMTAITWQPPASGNDLHLPVTTYNAIFSLLDVQTVNDVPGYFAQLAAALQPDGLLMLAFFAGDTLHELRQSWLLAEGEIVSGVSPRVAPMIGVRELGGLLQRAGLALPVADIDRSTVRYADAIALMRDVKAMGFANPLIGRATNLVSRRMLTRAAEHYHANFADGDGRIRATIEIAWANAWKPHASQPKPLKPGSASARLADALKTIETKLKS